LYLRATEARKPDPILKDSHAVQLVDEIDYDFSRFKLNPLDQVAAILRVRQFDRLTQDFIARNPYPVVVHIGCGFDTRFERVDNGQVEWYDMDLPEVISLRQQLIPSSERNHILGCSVFDLSWLEAVPFQTGNRYLFLAEGVFPYFTQEQVKQLFLVLADKYPDSELVCDGMSSFMLRLHNLELVASKVGARLQWGLKNGHEPEAWGINIHLISEWFYFDEPEPRLGAFKLMRYLPLFNKGVGIYHYQLGRTGD
ncbi:MAG TPA: class I SAM-dependent methyltransferase, partial [Anaerolineales bacterium]|nr:class I SAM-dependent methyltransferase [Anaerolineales bacterium]